MKITQFLFTLGCIICISQSVNAQYIQVVDNISPQNLVQNTLINSPCANVSNFTISSGTFSGSENSYGYFSAGTSNFPFANGVILSTGKATSAVGPNNSIISEGDSSWLGDPDLNAALGVSQTYNATILEFNFVPLTSKISFDYIFASEQYLSNPSSNQCQYTDGFAFLLKEDLPGATYQNLAVVPNTTIPVSVKTVRGPGTVCPEANPQYFDAFNGVNNATNFNGQTKILKAQATVTPGKNYHIKLVIADQGNQLYDSAIFLGGGSFQVGVDLGPDNILSKNNPICVGDSKVLDATQPGNNTYKWFANGVQIPNEFNALYTISDNTNTNEVLYSVEVSLGSTSCVVTGEVKIQFFAKPALNDASIINCDDNGDGFSIFDLTKLDTFIKSSATNVIPLNASNTLNYFYDIACTIAINNASNFINTTINQQNIYAKVANSFGCFSVATVNLQVTNNNQSQTFTICDIDNNQDGVTQINLSTQITPYLQPAVPAGLIIKYYLTKNDAITQTNELANLFSNTIANQQIIYGRISSNEDCLGIITITLNVFSFSGSNFKDEIKHICPLDTIKLEVLAGYSYVWSNGNSTDNFINVSVADTYSVIITASNNCPITKKFVVKPSESAIITSVDVNDFNDNQNTITINYAGLGNYEFSLDVFNNVAIGEYFVTVRDLYGCPNSISKKIYVLDFPKFFSPNNDGFNDVWQIANLQKNAVINIYDRFGKFLFQINENNNSWNGLFNNKQLPSDDYWFTLQLDNNRQIKSHFSLKR